MPSGKETEHFLFFFRLIWNHFIFNPFHLPDRTNVKTTFHILRCDRHRCRCRYQNIFECIGIEICMNSNLKYEQPAIDLICVIDVTMNTGPLNRTHVKMITKNK